MSVLSPKFSTEIIQELRLGARPEDAKRLEDLALGRRAFDWFHLGTSDLLLEDLFTFLQGPGLLSPPRSGHLGNWTEVSQGRGGLLDANDVVCRESRLGYPLIYDCNQTEDRELRKGDTVYLPGSIVEKGHREPLPLWTWDGVRFRERSRETGLFVPFTQTLLNGELLPLTELHRNRDAQIRGYCFSYHSSVLLKSEARVRDILRHLTLGALSSSNPAKTLLHVFDHAVNTQGAVFRPAIQREEGTYRVEDLVFTDTETLIDKALLPLAAAHSPGAILSRMEQLPTLMPLLSAGTIILLYALLNTHYPGHEEHPGLAGESLCVHLHWGADQMAGYPPLHPGYFSKTARSIDWLHTSLIARRPDLPGVLLILLPMSIFTLCPNNTSSDDQEIMSLLFDQVREALGSPAPEPEEELRTAERVVAQWWARSKNDLSRYFKSKFSSQRSIHVPFSSPDPSFPVALPGFKALSIREACLLVGLLHRLVEQEPA